MARIWKWIAALSFSLSLQVLAISPAETQLTSLLGGLDKQESTSENQRNKDIYQEALLLVKEGDEYREQLRQLLALADNAEVEADNIERELKLLDQTSLPNIDNLSLDALQKQIEIKRQDVALFQDQIRSDSQRLTDIERQISTHHQRLTPLQERLNAIRIQLDQMQFAPYESTNEPLRVRTQIHEATIKANIDLLKTKQQTAPTRSNLIQLDVNLQNKRLSLASQELEQLNAAFALKSKIQSDYQLAYLSSSNSAFKQDSIIQELISSYQDLQAQLNQILLQANNLQAEQVETRQQLHRLEQSFSNFQSQIEWLKFTKSYGEYLRQQINELPASYALKNIDEELISQRIKRHYLQQEMNSYAPQSYPIWRKDVSSQLNSKQEKSLQELWNLRYTAAKRLLIQIDNNQLEMSKLKVDHAQLNNLLTTIQTEVDQELFWIADVSVLNLATLTNLKLGVQWLFSSENWKELGQAFTEINIIWYLSWFVFSLLWFWQVRADRLWHQAYLRSIESKIGNITRDKFKYTLAVLAVSLLLALPLPLLLSSIAIPLRMSWKYPFAVTWGHALPNLALYLFCLFWLLQLSRKNGLFNTHFKWPMFAINRVRTLCLNTALFCIPAVLILSLGVERNDLSYYDSIGRLAFIWICGALIFVDWRLYNTELPVSYRNPIFKAEALSRRIVWYGAGLIPSVLALAALLGYFAMAINLLRQFSVSAIIGFLCIFIYYLARRWMLLQRRRIAFDRAKAKRAEIVAARSESENTEEDLGSNEGRLDIIEEPEIDLDTISAQSVGLLRAALTLTFVMTVLVSWSEMTNTFVFLDNFVLWEVNSGSGDFQVSNAITLKTLSMAIVVFTVSLILLKNLSGLLELMILQHIELSPGTSFAITTMIKYVVLLFSLTSILALLGIEWASLQWLVAALTVGLGFGLQEIFANFVSGLIILFEKPIRLGDTVTIRELTGKVSNIKTRATTIVDWDRKEIIVPNKAFITEQFINWSLSDSVTRLVLDVHVARDSNPALVTQLLQESVTDSSIILEVPAPEVFFVGFSERGMKYEIRAYVNEMGYRLPASHEIYMVIISKFKQHDIRVSSPQMDINLKEFNTHISTPAS
ncbi:hypothetical protein DBZ36_17865 [Alginatibacterium sediminis]|uniref:Miniconductance mechanosensitive channel MscM n=1 Tax=Alginatibacterium sediminis TaxID=2164068 RepID=A0A420E7F9_9ALTE|nr:mechanosensitive ion channel domain-containing protein [Alginatibacterium sediminis]RKF14517.1 hypothetical protein DBZ36_17865 [Alginatibacterium sediminis]